MLAHTRSASDFPAVEFLRESTGLDFLTVKEDGLRRTFKRRIYDTGSRYGLRLIYAEYMLCIPNTLFFIHYRHRLITISHTDRKTYGDIDRCRLRYRESVRVLSRNSLQRSRRSLSYLRITRDRFAYLAFCLETLSRRNSRSACCNLAFKVEASLLAVDSLLQRAAWHLSSGLNLRPSCR